MGADRLVRCRVRADPAPQGSHVSFWDARSQRVVTKHDSNRLDAWRDAVTLCARAAKSGPPLDCPVAVTVTFWMRAPKRRVRDVPTVPPDLDKILRSTFDALTAAGVWVDDARAVRVQAEKRYATLDEPPGALIEVLPLDG